MHTRLARLAVPFLFALAACGGRIDLDRDIESYVAERTPVAAAPVDAEPTPTHDEPEAVETTPSAPEAIEPSAPAPFEGVDVIEPAPTPSESEPAPATEPEPGNQVEPEQPATSDDADDDVAPETNEPELLAPGTPCTSDEVCSMGICDPVLSRYRDTTEGYCSGPRPADAAPHYCTWMNGMCVLVDRAR